MRRVLVLETNEALRQDLLLGLRRHDLEAEVVDGVAQARATLAGGRVDAIVLAPGAGSIRELLSAVFDSPSQAEIVALVGGRLETSPEARSQASPEARSHEKLDGGSGSRSGPWSGACSSRDLSAGLAAMREGAVDFVPMSSGAEGLALALLKVDVRASFKSKRDHAGTGHAPPQLPRTTDSAPRHRPGDTVAVPPTSPTMIGQSHKILAVLSMVRRLAGVRAGVLVGGESGTGKELVARALHDQSPWRDRPFVAVNCAAIPPGLVESELFGHVRGSFTDAVRDKRGLFEAAHGGTLFLDEIADLPLLLQVKLLRVLQDGVIRRVGDVDDLQVEVRVVAATARDLMAEVQAGRFREDLYYRLAGLFIEIPPLRERPDDIPLLARHFLARACQRLHISVNSIEPEALQYLCEHAWPGNVRELENTIERAAVLCTGEIIDVASLPDRLLAARSTLHPGTIQPVDVDDPANLSIKRASRRAEEGLIKRALAETGGNRTRAAELLEISHRALLYKIKEYRIVVPRN